MLGRVVGLHLFQQVTRIIVDPKRIAKRLTGITFGKACGIT
jgi:hypothetical protein